MAFIKTHQEITNYVAEGSVREFIGDGTHILRVPGLKKLLGVRVGIRHIPMTHIQRYPSNVEFAQKHEQEAPLLMLDADVDGTPILLRDSQSNFGMWQEAEPIYVDGEWDDQGERAASLDEVVTALTTDKGKGKTNR